MHIWTISAGSGANITAGPLRPHVFGARLYLRDKSGVKEIRGQKQASGVYLFPIAPAQVDVVAAKDGFLFLTTRHVLHVGSPDLKWGWRYKLEQNGAASTASNGDGAALNLDGAGFYNSPLENFDEPVELSRETIIFA